MGELQQRAQGKQGNSVDQLAQAGKEFLDETMAHTQDEALKLEMAAGAYLGFQVRNTLGIKEYCKKFGVDVSPFADGILRHNADIRQKVNALGVHDLTYDQWMDLLRSQIMPLIKQEMEVISQQIGGDTKQACQYVNNNASALTKRNTFKAFFPNQYRMVMNAP